MSGPTILPREQVERLAAEDSDGSYERDAIATAADLHRRLDELKRALHLHLWQVETWDGAHATDRLLRSLVPQDYAPLAPEAPGGGATTEAVLAELAERHPEDAEKLRAVLRVANGEGTPAECRVCAGLTVRMAAKVTGLAPARIEAIEQGAVASAEEFALLCTAYDVPGWAR